MVRMMVGREVSQLERLPSTIGPEVLRVHNISLPDPDRAGDYIVDKVSFNVRRGEIVGLFGVMGAGRTELLQTIFGLQPRSSGDVLIAGERIDNRSPSASIRAGLALAPEDRKNEGLVLSMNVAENVSLSCLERASQLGLLQSGKEQTLARGFVERLKIKTSSLRQRVRNLSGGNQQKVVISKWLAAGPKVLLLDEPTRGIDVGAKAEVHDLIRAFAAQGGAALVISSDLPEVLALGDRILVMREGQQKAVVDHANADQEQIMAIATGQRSAA
jgi:ribose transport system ATP-binding protein